MSKLAQLLAQAISQDEALLLEIQQEIVNSTTKPTRVKAKKKVVAKVVKPKATRKKKVVKRQKKSKQSENLDANVVSGKELARVEKELEVVATVPVKRDKISASDCIAHTRQDSVKTRNSPLSRREPMFITADATFKPEFIKENKKIKAQREEIERRPSVQMVNVKCHVCGAEEKVSPALAPIRYGRDEKAMYRCNSCK